MTFPDLCDVAATLDGATLSTTALSFRAAAASSALASSSPLTESLILCSAAAMSAAVLSASALTPRLSSSISAFSFAASSTSSSSLCSIAVRLESSSSALSSAAAAASSLDLAVSSLALSCFTCALAFSSCSVRRLISSATRAVSLRVRSMDVINLRPSSLMDSSSTHAEFSSASAASSDESSSCSSCVLAVFADASEEEESLAAWFLAVAFTGAISARRSPTPELAVASRTSRSLAVLRLVFVLVSSASSSDRPAPASSTRACSSFPSQASRSTPPGKCEPKLVLDVVVDASASLATFTSSCSLRSSRLTRSNSCITSTYTVLLAGGWSSATSPLPPLLLLLLARAPWSSDQRDLALALVCSIWCSSSMAMAAALESSDSARARSLSAAAFRRRGLSALDLAGSCIPGCQSCMHRGRLVSRTQARLLLFPGLLESMLRPKMLMASPTDPLHPASCSILWEFLLQTGRLKKISLQEQKLMYSVYTTVLCWQFHALLPGSSMQFRGAH